MLEYDPPAEVRAILEGDIDVVRRAVAADSGLVKRHLHRGLTALQLAAGADQDAVAQLLLDAGARLDLYSACRLGRVKELRRLLDEDPSSVNRRGPNSTPLLSSAAAADRLETAQLLLERDPSPEPRSQALLRAATPLMARLLLDHGADVNTADHAGLTRLHSAAAVADAEMIALLLERGADPTLKTVGGQTALSLASRYGSTARGGEPARAWRLLYEARRPES